MTTAYGSPCVSPKWTRSSKQGIGTAYHTSCHTWFTLSHGILNEIYYPNVDCPNTRDLQFLITDGETFCHEEKRDLDHKLEYPEQSALYYRLTNCDRQGRYMLIKEIITDPHASVVLMYARLEIHDKKLLEKLRVYALLAPHLKRHGYGNTAWVEDVNAHRFFHIERSGIYATFGCYPDFTRRSVGYVGATDGWRDLKDNLRMDCEFDRAENGNIAAMGEVDLTQGAEFTIGLAFGGTPHSAAAKLCQSLSLPFKIQREVYVKQWQCRQVPDERLNQHTSDCGRLLRLSECILLAHEDKIFQGAFVASMSIPWGEMKGDDDLGGYHLVLGALNRAGDMLDFVQVRHEEMAAFMACAHAKFTGEISVCMATSVPGAVHLLNGLYDAQMDHQPVVAIVGQQARAAMGGNYQQEIDLISLYKDVAREYVHMASDPIQIRHLVDRAIRIAKVERTVTCIIIPNDVQELDAVETPPRAHGTIHSGTDFSMPHVVPKELDLLRAAEC